jgi:hypothetical protein
MKSTAVRPSCQCCGQVTRTLFVGGKSKDQLLHDLLAAGINLNPAGFQLFAEQRFATCLESYRVEISDFAVACLGFPQGARQAEIFAAAEELGWTAGPLALAAHFRLQYLDQPEGFIGFPPSQQCAPPGSLTVAAPPLSADQTGPAGFYLRRISGVLWLRGYHCNAAHLWSPTDRWVFTRSVPSHSSPPA